MPSPACTVSDNGGGAVGTTNGVDVVDDGTTVTIILADQGGVRTWSCAIVDTDDQVAAPTVTVNETNKTASFTKPAGPWALIFQSQINGGINLNGVEDPTYTTTFGIYVKTTSKQLRLGAANERAEGSAAFGWTTKVNAAIRAVESGGGGGSGGVTWQVGTDAAYVITGTSGTQKIKIPALTGAHTWTLPSAGLTDGMIVELADILAHYDGSHAITLDGGTHHIFVEGVDKGTTWAVDASLLYKSSLPFTWNATDSAWYLS